MTREHVTEWLRSWARKQARLDLLGFIGALAGGILLLALTWGLAYMISLVALGPWIGYRHWFLPLSGWILLPLLFWGNARTSREYLSEYEVTCATASGTVVNFYIPGVGMGSTVNPLAPNTIHAGAKMITDILYCGPRTVSYALQLLRKSRRLQRMDIEGCAAVLTVLLLTRRRMSFQEILGAIDGLEPERVFRELRDVEGVLFLKNDPPGLSLTSDLKQALQATPDTRVIV